MAHPTTPAVARPASVFAEWGIPWTAVPSDLPRGVARDAMYAIVQAARGITRTKAPDRVLAQIAGLSVRSLQRGLKILEAMGKIERLRRHGGRVITILFRLAGRKAKPVHRSAKTSHSNPPRPSFPSSVRDKIEEDRPVPAGAASTPADPGEDEEPSPWTRRWFGGNADVRAKLEAVPVLRG